MIDIKNIKKSILFFGMTDQEIKSILKCLDSQIIKYTKESYVLRVGDIVNNIGIVSEGILNIIKEDSDGERALIAQIEPGDHFAEALCCAGIKTSPLNVIAEKDSVIVLLDFYRILNICSSACTFHTKLIENMLKILATKNLNLQKRMDYLSKKTIRKRILKYLYDFPINQNESFQIPFNREELADYLCVDRSALSRELMNLKKENKIDYWKNSFKIIK